MKPFKFPYSQNSSLGLLLLCLLISSLATSLRAEQMEIVTTLNIYQRAASTPFPLYTYADIVVKVEGNFEVGPISSDGIPAMLFERGEAISLNVELSSGNDVFGEWSFFPIIYFTLGDETESDGTPALTLRNGRYRAEADFNFPAFNDFLPNNNLIPLELRIDYLVGSFIPLYAFSAEGAISTATFPRRTARGVGVIGTVLTEVLGTTATPSLPQFILHNPPGDESYTYYSAGEQLCTTQNFTFNEGTEEEYSASVKVGASGTVPLVGSDYEAYLEISGTANIGTNETTEGTTEICHSVTSTWENSGGEYSGSDGDVYVGYAMNYNYGVARQVYYDGGTNLKVRGDLALVPSGTSTFAHSEHYIKTVLIPADSTLAANTNSPELRAQLNQQVRIWREAISRNTATYAAIRNNPNGPTRAGNLNIEGGIFTGAVDREFVEVNTYATEIELFVDTELMVAAGVEVAGSGVSGYAAVRGSLSNSVRHEASTQGSKAIGYLLHDDDSGDHITGSIHIDQRYGTYIFLVNEQNSQTSCPYEGGYQLDQPAIAFADNTHGATFNNLPTGEAHTFPVLVKNLSNAGRTYFLNVVSNNGNLTISGLDGELTSTQQGRSKSLTANSEEQVNITIRQADESILNYEDIVLRLYSLCQEDDDPIESFITFNANFVVAPDNNEPCNAAPIPTNGIVQNGYTNINANARDQEQQLAPSTANCAIGWCAGDLVLQHSVWFQFTAPESGFAAISTLHAGTDFNTQLALYEATDCNNFSNYRLLAANDNHPEDVQNRSYLNYRGLTSGETYYVVVDGYAGASGNISISIVDEDPTADDDGDGVPNTEDRCAGGDDNLDDDGDRTPNDCDTCPELGRIGLAFDGEDDYLGGVELNNFNPTTHTIEAWLYVEAYPTTTRSWPLLLGTTGSGQHWLINADGSTAIGSYNVRSINPNLPLQEWVHIATTYDGTTFAVYINGELFDAQDIGFAYPTPRLTISKPVWSGNEHHHGSIDELRIWNTTRTQAEIQASMRQELSGTETHLIAYYNFAEGLPNGDNQCVARVHDKVGNYDLTLNNFAKAGSSSNWTAGAPIFLRHEQDNDEGNACFLDRNLGFPGIDVDTLYAFTDVDFIDLPVVTPDNGTYSGDYVLGSTFDVAAAGAGTFEVVYTVTDEVSGCSVSDVVVVQVSLATATEDIFTTASLKIWPNPSNSQVNLRFDQSLDESIQLSLWHANGKLVQRRMLEPSAASRNHQLDLATLPAGMYWLSFQSVSGEVLGQRKIVKQ